MAQPTTETASKPRRSLKRAPPARFKEGTSDPRGLPPACYVSPTFHEREIETIFRKEWICIGRVEDVAKPGDYVSIDIVGEPLVMVRDLEGNLRVHSRICRHRSMILVEGAGNARSFNCPYHAWVYGLDGRLAGAPEMEHTPGFDRAACRLPGPKVEVWEGFVFVNFDPDAKSLAPRVEKLARFLANWHMGEMVTVRSFDFDVDWNWKVMIDNYIEAYHHIGAHRLSLEPVMPTRLVRVEDLPGPFTIVHMPHVEDTDVSGFYTTGEAQAKLPPIPTLTEEEKRRPSLIHMFPAHLMSTYADRMEYYLVLPRGADALTIRKVMCVPKAALERPDFERAMKVVTDQYLKFRVEDVGVNDGVMRGLRSRYAAPPHLCHLERPLLEFAEWLLKRTGPPPAR